MRPHWTCQAHRLEIPIVRPATPISGGVDKRRRKPSGENLEHIIRDSGDGSSDDVRGGPHRHPHRCDPTFEKIDGDVGTGVADADDEDVGSAVRPRVAISGRVQQLAFEASAARPLRDEPGAVAPGSDHDSSTGAIAVSGPQMPGAITVDADDSTRGRRSIANRST